MKSKALFVVFLLMFTTLLLSAEDPPPFPTASDQVKEELWAAFEDQVNAQTEKRSLTFDLFTPELDHAFLTPDGNTAVMWLKLRDDYGKILASEPGLVLAQKSDSGWLILLPGDAAWEDTITSLPDGMIPAELDDSQLTVSADDSKGPITGYYLPYVAGTTHWLEGSISHFQYIPELGYPSCSETYCRYAYDLTDADHYPLVASKDGVIYATRDSCTDGNPYCTNYVVLYEPGNQVYQIYLHLAYNTIPDKLTSGTSVKRGQYLGDTDDTGYSTSQHVHFMVVSSIWVGASGYYWGQSIDVRFADVSINNGIPRTCYEVTSFPIYDGATQCLGNKADPRNPANDWFTSGNTGAYPPSGSLTTPAAGATVTSGTNPLMDVRANASDDVRVKAVQLVIKQDGTWTAVGPKVSQTIAPGVYDWDVNLCEIGPLNGALEVALRVWDYEGNIAQALSPRIIQVDHACPPPTSQLNPAITYDSSAVYLSWQAQSNGVEIGSFDLQWRVVSGTWETANMGSHPANQTSAWFVGQAGTQYEFRLRAVDVNGQPEAWPLNDTAETSALIPTTCSSDQWEPDDNVGQATTINLDSSIQHNLCGIGNSDWVKVNLTAEQYYRFDAVSTNAGAAVKISLFAEDGTTQLTQTVAPGIGKNAVLLYYPLSTGTYYFKIEPLVPDLFGTQAIYTTRISAVHPLFFPLIFR